MKVYTNYEHLSKIFLKSFLGESDTIFLIDPGKRIQRVYHESAN